MAQCSLMFAVSIRWQLSQSQDSETLVPSGLSGPLFDVMTSERQRLLFCFVMFRVCSVLSWPGITFPCPGPTLMLFWPAGAHLQNVINCVPIQNTPFRAARTWSTGHTHLPGSPIVKIVWPGQVLYTVRTVLVVAFQICVTLNSFMALLGSYEPKCDF